jgi:hypothetical protein
MASWSGYEDEYGICAGRYQYRIDQQAREDMRLGWQHPDGMRRPVDPVCSVHGYGMVDGLCGVCVLTERDVSRVVAENHEGRGSAQIPAEGDSRTPRLDSSRSVSDVEAA